MEEVFMEGKLSKSFSMSDLLDKVFDDFAVFLGANKETGERVAVTTLHHKKIADRAKQKTKELQSLFELHHPNVLDTKGVYWKSGEKLKGSTAFVVGELAEGGLVIDYLLEQAQLVEDDVRTAMRGVFQGLQAVHERGVVHGDLNPRHVHIRTPGAGLQEVAIGGFGVAALMADERDIKFFTKFCSPEVLSSQQYTSKADMWSAGVMMYLFLSGLLPFYDADGSTLRARIIEGDYDAPGLYFDKISPQGVDLMRKLLQNVPSDRPSAEEALQHPWFARDGKGADESVQIDESLGVDSHTISLGLLRESWNTCVGDKSGGSRPFGQRIAKRLARAGSLSKSRPEKGGRLSLQ